jgi:HEAT repeat protein
MLDQAFDALKKYDWGTDQKPLKPIDEAITGTHGDAAARKELETRLAAVLKSDVSRDAKDYVCRKLMIVGTAASAPALAALLENKELSHMARFALERIPAPEAAQALRDALPKLSGALLAGVIGSLGVRRDTASVPALKRMLGDGDPLVARAAAHALGDIRNVDAARALTEAWSRSHQAKAAITDASLACAEALLMSGNKAEAQTIYKSLSGEDQPRHVRLAATRGMLTGAGKKD